MSTVAVKPSYNEGRQAFKDGTDMIHCPYDKYSDDWYAWSYGWKYEWWKKLRGGEHER